MSKLCRCWLPAIQLSLAHQPRYWCELQMLPPAFALHTARHRQSSAALQLLCLAGGIGGCREAHRGTRDMHAAQVPAEPHSEVWRSKLGACSHMYTHLQPWRCNAIIGVVCWNIPVLEALQQLDHLGHQGLVPCSRPPTLHMGAGMPKPAGGST